MQLWLKGAHYRQDPPITQDSPRVLAAMNHLSAQSCEVNCVLVQSPVHTGPVVDDVVEPAACSLQSTHQGGLGARCFNSLCDLEFCWALTYDTEDSGGQRVCSLVECMRPWVLAVTLIPNADFTLARTYIPN